MAQGVTCTTSLTIEPSRPAHPDLDPTGPYLPEETVEFCVAIEFEVGSISEGNNCQWIQGVLPVLGDGWNKEKSDLANQGPAGSAWLIEDNVDYNVDNPELGIDFSCDGSKIMTFGEGDGLLQGTLLPAGWWFTSAGGTGCENDGLVDNMWGLPAGCGTMSVVEFCFNLVAKSSDEMMEDDCFQDLGVDIYTFADGETGCWTNVVCGFDPPVLFSASADLGNGTVSNILLGNVELIIAPNPVLDFIKISSDLDHKLAYKISNAEGDFIAKGSMFTNNILDFSDYESGVYFISISNDDKSKNITHRLLKL